MLWEAIGAFRTALQHDLDLGLPDAGALPPRCVLPLGTCPPSLLAPTPCGKKSALNFPDSIGFRGS
jgi:hypothetical protein